MVYSSFNHDYVCTHGKNHCHVLAILGAQTWYGLESASTHTFRRTTSERLDYYNLRPVCQKHICFHQDSVICHPTGSLSTCDMEVDLSATPSYRRFLMSANSTLQPERNSPSYYCPFNILLRNYALRNLPALSSAISLVTSGPSIRFVWLIYFNKTSKKDVSDLVILIYSESSRCSLLSLKFVTS